MAGHEIYTNYSKYVESEDGLYHSYTFPAKDLNYPELLKNLVISLQPDGSYKEMFITYDLTEEEIELINQGYQIDFSGKVYYDDGFCFDVVAGETKCCFNVHTYQMIQDGQTCQCSATGQPVAPEDVVINIVPCFDDTGGSGDPFGTDNDNDDSNSDTEGTYDPNGPEGGSGTNSGDTTSIITCKGEDCPDEFEEQENPCDILKGVTDDPRLDPVISNLKTKTNGPKEYAYEIEYRYDTPSQEYQHIPILIPTGENYSVSVGTGGYIQGQAHNHPKNGLAVPSWGDIRWTSLHEEASIGLNDGNAYNIVVVKDPENTNNALTYAVTINDLAALQTQINYEMTRPKILRTNDTIEKINKINKKFGNEFDGIENDSDALEEKFLEVFADYGISLFKKNEETNNWEELKLVDNEVIKEPCDN